MPLTSYGRLSESSRLSFTNAQTLPPEPPITPIVAKRKRSSSTPLPPFLPPPPPSLPHPRPPPPPSPMKRLRGATHPISTILVDSDSDPEKASSSTRRHSSRSQHAGQAVSRPFSGVTPAQCPARHLVNELRAEMRVVSSLLQGVSQRWSGSFAEVITRCSKAHLPDLEKHGFPTTWLVIHFDSELQIFPRLDLGQRGFAENALIDGQPSTWYHGTHGDHARNILQERYLRLGTSCTSGRSGVWHGAAATAARYAWPTVWPGCVNPTMTMFELKVSTHKKHSRNAFVSQRDGTYEVVAILLSHYSGDMDEPKLRKTGFIKLRNSKSVVYLEP